MRNDEVFFWQSNDEDCDCIGDFENCEITCCGSVVTATVMINDPFLRQCMVVDDEGKEFFVSYRQLRASLPDETAPDDTNEEPESPPTIIDYRPPVPKKRCPPKSIPFVDAISLIPHSDENVELKYAPCYNNILKVGSLTNYANATFEVKELFFDCSKRKAFVKMIGKTNPDIEVRMPALEVQVIEDEIEEFNIHTLVHPINQAFAVFSAVKRMVGFAQKKHSMTKSLIPATPLTRKMCGFETTSSKETVKFSGDISNDFKGSNQSWDSVLGKRWDVIVSNKEGEDAFIKILRFTEHREFGFFMIRCSFVACRGHFKCSDSYRSLYQTSLQ